MRALLTIMLCFSLIVGSIPTSFSAKLMVQTENNLSKIQKMEIEKQKNTSLTRQFLLFIWELPQNICGIITLLAVLFLKDIKKVELEKGRLFVGTTKFRISLGFFVFWDVEEIYNGLLVKKHEYGHSLQSQILGPLYLPVVGGPSLIRKAYDIWHKYRYGYDWPNYFRGFPEDWADRLGKANRSHKE